MAVIRIGDGDKSLGAGGRFLIDAAVCFNYSVKMIHGEKSRSLSRFWGVQRVSSVESHQDIFPPSGKFTQNSTSPWSNIFHFETHSRLFEKRKKKKFSLLNMSNCSWRPPFNLSWNCSSLSEDMANYFPLRLPAAAACFTISIWLEDIFF